MLDINDYSGIGFRKKGCHGEMTVKNHAIVQWSNLYPRCDNIQLISNRNQYLSNFIR